jgi:hypothetical protein
MSMALLKEYNKNIKIMSKATIKKEENKHIKKSNKSIRLCLEERRGDSKAIKTIPRC